MTAKPYVSLAVLAVIIPTISIFGQGPLTPPSAPAPTMKTLDQIEARTPIDATHTPGDANNTFIISQAGSYYLTANFTAGSGITAIEVTASNVTIDLKGFTITGSAIGIFSSNNNQITVSNGHLTGFQEGVSLGGLDCAVENLTIVGRGTSGSSGVGGSIPAGDLSVSHCTVRSCLGQGINIVSGAVKDCSVTGASLGIIVNSFGVISHCRTSSCTSIGTTAGKNSSSSVTVESCSSIVDTTGFSAMNAVLRGCTALLPSTNGTGYLGANSSFTDCTVIGTGNTTGAGFNITVAGNLSNCVARGGGYGFTVNAPSLLTKCSAGGAAIGDFSIGSHCELVDCVADGSTSTSSANYGFNIAAGCVVRDCLSSAHKSDGFRYGSENSFTGNLARGNQGSGFVYAVGSNGLNRLDGNMAMRNSIWGFSTTTDDTVVRNGANANGTGGANYNPSTGYSSTGPIQSPNTATSPWANFE